MMNVQETHSTVVICGYAWSKIITQAIISYSRGNSPHTINIFNSFEGIAVFFQINLYVELLVIPSNGDCDTILVTPWQWYHQH